MANRFELTPTTGSITFYFPDCSEAMRIDPDGKFYIKGKLVTEDIEVFHMFKQWLASTNLGR